NMMGKDGVVVIINGKVSNMPTDVVLKMLEGMSATDLSKIELITTPPASVDAQGNAGYINIVTKNNPEQGWQGNTSLNLGYGHGWNNLISANVQYRKDKFSTSMGANYAMDYRDQFTYVDRTYRGVDTYSGNDRKPFKDHINYRLGVNYDLSQKTSLGANFSGYLRLWDMTSNGTFRNDQNDTSSHLAVVETNDWSNQNYNINLKHAFSKNSTWSLDGDILHFSNDGFTDNTVQFRQGDNIYGRSLIGTTKNTPFDIKVLKSDYIHTIGQTKYSVGAKMTQTDFTNDIDVKVDGTTLSEFASAGKFKENILAFYTTADFKPTDKIAINLGVRYEATTAEFKEKDESIYNKKYQNLFPSAFISYQLSDNYGINFQYSKRIERPAFSDISSFILVNDPNFIFSGNALLQPSFSNNLAIGSRFHNLNVQLQYSYTDENISRHQMKYDPITNIITRRPENLDYSKNITLSASFPINITKNWQSRWYGAFLYMDIKDKNGVTYTRPSFQTNMNHTITLPAKTLIDLNAMYFHKMQDGMRTVNPLINVNIAIKKQLQNQGILTLGVDDVFDTFRFGDEAALRQVQYLIKAGIDFSHTTFKVGYTHHLVIKNSKKCLNAKS
ncbi:MAG: TonB-dependent receptor, partial [Saprospiraceae bacterium]